MLRLGCIILTAWIVLNIVPSVFIVANTMAQTGHTPALYTLLNENDVNQLNAETLATIDSIAVYANGMNIGFCLLSLATIWMGLIRRLRWTFWALLLGFSAALLAGVGADISVGVVLPQINVISGVILSFGFALAATDLYTNNRRAVPDQRADETEFG